MALFPLQQSALKAFHVTGNVAFRLREDNILQITSSFFERVWVSEPLPLNFRAAIKFKTDQPEGKFIFGIGNGENWKPDYHFVMNPIWTAFKKYLDSADHWDRYIHLTREEANLIKPDTLFHVIFERQNGIARIFLNGDQLFVVEDEADELNKYQFLFIAGTLLVEDLTVEPING